MVPVHIPVFLSQKSSTKNGIHRPAIVFLAWPQAAAEQQGPYGVVARGRERDRERERGRATGAFDHILCSSPPRRVVWVRQHTHITHDRGTELCQTYITGAV